MWQKGLAGGEPVCYSSCRLFSEGGDFAPQELKTFQRRLKEQSKQINTTEQAIRSELEVFESKSLQQVSWPPSQQSEKRCFFLMFLKTCILLKVKKVSDKVEETLSVWKSEVKFTEKVEEIISSTRIQIRAEVLIWPLCVTSLCDLSSRWFVSGKETPNHNVKGAAVAWW